MHTTDNAYYINIGREMGVVFINPFAIPFTIEILRNIKLAPKDLANTDSIKSWKNDGDAISSILNLYYTSLTCIFGYRWLPQ